MSPRRASIAAAALIALLAGCRAAPSETGSAAAAPAETAPATRPRLGLLTGLPLYHPLGADVAAIAAGTAAVPWQRAGLERAFTLEPLDTLSPIPALAPGAPPTDPLAGLARLAVIQPRGLSPADNVALDDWVRGGGHLLMVLDPLLTGDYDLPIVDPRHPPGSAIIPPVVARWGMSIAAPLPDTDDAATGTDTLPGGAGLPYAWPGSIALLPGAAGKACVRHAARIAVCRVGKGQVTLIADAALFEHPELAGEDGAALRAVVLEAVG